MVTTQFETRDAAEWREKRGVLEVQFVEAVESSLEALYLSLEQVPGKVCVIQCIFKGCRHDSLTSLLVALPRPYLHW